MKISPLREFIWSAMLWLPLMFALWFALSTVVAFPIVRLAHVFADLLMPDLLSHAGQNFAQFAYAYVVDISGVAGLPGGRLEIDEQSVYVLIYAYSMPLFCGLVVASTSTWRSTFVQWGIGLSVLAVTCALGVALEALYTIRDGTGNAVAAALAEGGYAAVAAQAGQAANAFIAQRFDAAGLNVDLLALARQFGYLILPPVVPIVMWILLNRTFLESLVGWDEDADEADSAARGDA